MPTLQQGYWRDANRVPITYMGMISSKTITLVGSNNTYNIPLFTLTGSVQINALWSVVTTVIGVNHTAATWRINDQTTPIYLAVVAGVTLSGLAAGTMLIKKGLVGTAPTLISNAVSVVTEAAAVATNIFTPVIITAKTGVLTQLEYHYATTDTPTTGAIETFAAYVPLTEDATLLSV